MIIYIEESVKGLGRLPSWLTSVSDCLLFNTPENPYLKYESKDNLGIRDRQKDIVNEDNNKQNTLQAQPKTIKEKNSVMEYDMYDIGYRPQLENVPQFNTSTRLEGLTNTADDITWQGNKFAKQKIAPSHVTFKDLPTLEGLTFGFQDDVVFDDDETAPPPFLGKTTNNNSNNTNNKTNNTNTQQPSSKNQTQPKQNNTNANNNNNSNTQPQKSSIPPPSMTEKKNEDDGAGGDGDDNSRNALLEAIRKGRKLKSAPSGRKEKPKPPPVVARPSLMDVLKERLAERNRLISGAGRNEENINKAKTLDTLTSVSSSQNNVQATKDKTGLGLDNISQHMKDSMNFIDNDDGGSDAGSWNED